MDHRAELSSIIKANLKVPFGKVHLYPNISDKELAKATKSYDQALNTNKIVAICDIAGGKAGMIFMLAGAYYKYIIGGTFYFNYEDISKIIIHPDKKGRTDSIQATIDISFKNGTALTIGFGTFEKQNLKDLLTLLIAKVSEQRDIVSFQDTGNMTGLSLSTEQTIKCNAIIHTASSATGAIGAGLAQLPFADTFAITPIQIGMVTSIGKEIFDIEITEAAAKGILSGLALSIGGRYLSQALVGWIPGVGNGINAATAAALTEAIGWMAVAHFYNQQQEYKAKYRIEGMKQGFNQASEEYEAKLRTDADYFLKEKKAAEKEVKRFDQLLSKYEIYIKYLENQIAQLQSQLQGTLALEAPQITVDTEAMDDTKVLESITSSTSQAQMDNLKYRLNDSRRIYNKLSSLKKA